jgi:hypothetical protein
MLLWDDEDCFAISCFSRGTSSQDGALDIFPDIWSIVSVKIDDLLFEN